MADETIGSVAVEIVGDYSSLSQDIEAASQVAQAGGEKIAAAFTESAAGADTLSEAVATAASGMDAFDAKIQELVDSGSTLADALAQVEATGAGVGEGLSAAGAAAAEATSGVEALGTAEEGIAAGAEAAAQNNRDFSESAKDAGEESESASSRINELGEAFLEISGLRMSVDVLRDFAAEAIEVYASTEKATIALGLLTGDATAASETIEQLKETAQDLAVPFENLVQMDQQMTAFGFSAQQTAQALTAAADAAAATGASFDTAAQSLDRMALSGMAGSRQLVQLGLSAQDLADSMGVSVDQVTKAFKALDESVRMDVLIDALQKFQGAAETTADSTSGALTRLKNAWALDMESMGKDLAPVVTAFANWYQRLDLYIAAGLIKIQSLAEQTVHYFAAINQALDLNFSGAKQQLAEASQAAAEAAAQIKDLVQLHDQDAAATANHTAKTKDEVAAEVASSLATQQAGQSIGNLVGHYKDWDAASLQIPTTEQAIANSADATNIVLAQQGINLAAAQTVLKDVLQRYADGTVTWLAVQKALTAVNQAQGALNKTLLSFPDISAPVNDYAAAVTSLQGPLKDWVTGTQDLGTYTLSATDILKKMGITIADNGDAVTKQVGLYEQLEAASNTTLNEEDAAWAKISTSLSKMTGDQLPMVISLYNQHLAQIKDLGASEGEILQVEQQRYQAEIKIDEQTGKSATDAIIGLNNTKLAQQALTDASQLWGNTVVGVQADIIKGFEGMGQSISQVIVEGGNMADAFKKIGEQIAETILTTIINAGLKAIVDAIITSVIPTYTTMQTSSVVAITTMQTAMHAATAAMTADFTALNAQVVLLNANITALAGGSTGAGGAAGGMDKAGTGILGLVSVISQVITAIASIVQAIEQAHTNTLLDRIEHNTRYLQIEAEKFFQTDIWDIDSGLLAKFDMIFNRLGDMWATEQIIATELSGVTVVGGGGGGGGAPPVAPGGGGVTVVTGGNGGSSSPILTGAPSVPTSAGIQPTVPSVPGSPPVASVPAGTASASASGGSVVQANFTIQAAQNPLDTARAVVAALKTVSPKFGPFSS